MSNFNTARPTWKQLLLLILLSLTSLATVAKNDPVVTSRIEGDFHDIANNIRTAIIGKGISIAHELAASDMLNRTAPAYGYETNTYTNARTFEFCSALISHKLARQDPDNIILCPFTISVYSLTNEPGIVRVSYRVPVGRPGSEAIIKEIITLISGIIEDASW